MRSLDTQIPLILLVILMLSAFVPVIPVILINLNAAIIIVLHELLNGPRNEEIYNIINTVVALLGLVGYGVTFNKGWKLICLCLYLFSMIPLVAFNVNILLNNSIPYFVPIMIESVIVTMPLYFIGIIKERKQNTYRQKHQPNNESEV